VLKHSLISFIMIELVSKGGPLVWILLGSLIFAGAIFLERLSYFHRASMNVGEFLTGLAGLVRRKNFAEAIQECIATRVPAGRVIHAALLRHEAPREQLKEVVQEAGQLEVPRLERFLSILHAIAHTTPLLGLMGTLIGLLDSFTALSASGGVVGAAEIARGLYHSLVTAALGIAVAVPAYLGYAFLCAKSRSIMHELERAGIEIVNIIEDSRTRDNIVEFRREETGPLLRAEPAPARRRGTLRPS
jgi:biopolymer transport protein ExbB